MARKPGLTHKQIAAELGVSHHTVSSYNRSEVFRAAYEALTNDLEALSINALQELRTESEALALESLQILRASITDPAMKPSEKLPLLSEAARWFSLLHPEPKSGIAVSTSAIAGDAQAHSTVFIYSGSEPENEQKAALTGDSTVAIWLPYNERDVIDVSGSSGA
jgi:transcriptional regulator with XRE-family HTH domain